jgi:hypothetical protein
MDEPRNVLARSEVLMRDRRYVADVTSTETSRIFMGRGGCLAGFVTTIPRADFTVVDEGGGRTRLSVNAEPRGVERMCEELVVHELGGTPVD